MDLLWLYEFLDTLFIHWLLVHCVMCSDLRKDKDIQKVERKKHFFVNELPYVYWIVRVVGMKKVCHDVACARDVWKLKIALWTILCSEDSVAFYLERVLFLRGPTWSVKYGITTRFFFQRRRDFRIFVVSILLTMNSLSRGTLQS